MKKYVLILAAVAALYSCNKDKAGDAGLQKKVQTYLDGYNKEYQKLNVLVNETSWKMQIHIVEGDSTNAVANNKAMEAYAKYTGSSDNIKMAKAFLEHQDVLTPLQVKQLKSILYKAANNPETLQKIVSARIKAETKQTENLFGFDFKIDGKSVSANDIDGVLADETNLAKRRKAWESSKEVGKGLKTGLVNLRNLRNQTVQGLGYKDFFEYQVSDYGMTTDEMLVMLKQFNKDLYPLFRELHTYARYEYAKKYGVKDVPDMLPADWLPNRWGQDWSSLVDVKGIDLDAALKPKGAEWIVKQGERFYVSIGFPELPKTFWEKSDLYPAPAGANYKKNNHASAWHMDLDKDVRSLMSVEPNSEWYETSHHELGHIYYYLSYSTPEVPYLMREGANRAYHEALGSLMGMAAMQKPFMENLNLIPKGTPSDEMQTLLKEALNYVVFIPFSTGTMSMFEHDLYAENLPADQFNKRWWELAAQYQGIVPPTVRGEEFCDAATKTHINDDAAQYYDYALSYILLFQIHDHIAKKILHQDPHATNYYGNKEVGKFIQDIMKSGATGDWRKLLREKTGSDLSAKAMLEYFNPLMDYLKNENKGRKYTLPALK
ncbi:MAG: peptidase [Flavobacterium sp. BFFFF1]|uniref:M2 family metallopeptidase n=1 Tax=Flavobacterium sp. BFFFF1 TaxID=2015557 RepID=UPI000BDD236E|nr:M2 family metallopeptidase [Flavobacterium sp. BFFFF1]OYU79227.1 MAG: peptidase [Flavobacterium sp. BFFFF1]